MTTDVASTVGIRCATADDIPAIHRLLSELAQTTGLPHKFVSGEADLQRYGFGDAPMFEALLAERDGGAIGLALFFYTYSSWRGEPGIYIQDLVVSEQARGLGLGRRLIAAAVSHASRHGATHLRLSVEHDNEQAIGFYKSLGLRHSDNEKIFEASGDAFGQLATAT